MHCKISPSFSPNFESSKSGRLFRDIPEHFLKSNAVFPFSKYSRCLKQP